MTDRGVQCAADLRRMSPAYSDAPCQPLLASRGSYLGQIKLSVYQNCGLLTCHVIQARHLTTKRGGTCDPFVKLSLVPDESLRTRCKTDVVMDTNNPLFDEKFSFELIEEDMRKRLYISIWNKVSGKDCKDEFLGCMSFGIRHLQNDKRAINGWYYLLNEDVGRRKHLQAVVKKQHLREQSSNSNNSSIPKVNQDIMWMDPYTITIQKEKSGYGFTVSGFSPVFVCRIEKGSAAEKAGLQKDDCIVRIDGLNVSRSTSDSVAKIIRATKKQLTVEIQRPQVVTTMEVKPSVIEPWQAVSSTPMVRNGIPPPAPHIPGAPIPSRPPLPSRPPPSIRPPAPPPAWNLEVESKEPVYGNCGVFGESDPLYSTVTGSSSGRLPCHSSASSSSGYQDEPQYGMIRVPRQPSSIALGSNSVDSGSSSGASSRGLLLQARYNQQHSSSAGSYEVPSYIGGICQLPRRCKVQSSGDAKPKEACMLPRYQSMLPQTVPHHDKVNSGEATYVTMQYPMSAGGLSRADIYNQYRLCHDTGYDGSVPQVTAQPRVLQHISPNIVKSHEDYDIYGHTKSYGSTGSTGSADSGSLRRSRTLPRKKKVHFQEMR